MSETTAQIGTRFQQAVERLTRAVERLDQAVDRAHEDRPGDREADLVKELEAANAANVELRAAHATLAERLDGTIARLRGVLDD